MVDSKKQRPLLFQRQSEGKVTVDFFLAVGVFGFSFFMAWMLLVFGTTLFSQKLIYGGELSLAVHGVLALAVVVTLFLAQQFTAFVFRLRPALPFLAMILSSANLWVEVFPFIEPDDPFLLFTWALTGVGFALFVIQWSEFISLLAIGQSKLFFSLAMFVGIILLFGFLVTNTIYQPVLVFVLPLFSVLAFIFLKRYYQPFLEIEFIKRETSNARMQLSWKPVLSTVISSTALGFILAWFIKYGHNIVHMDFFLALFLALSMLLMIIDAVHWKRFGENFVMRAFLLFVAVGILPLLFISDDVKVICGIIMLCGMVFIVVQGNSAISEHINLFHLAPMQAIAFGRMFSYFGILIGTVFGYIAFWTDLFGEITLAVVTVFLMLVFVIETVFVMMENKYPIDEEMTSQGGIITVSRPLQPDQGETPHTDFEFDDIHKDPNGRWRRKCDAVATSYGLTMRQREVLFLLARGRNAEYLTNELVISPHTAKAHIYNIYQKLNIHSNQELIDLVEKVYIDT